MTTHARQLAAYQTPPRTRTATGAERRVGLELEFGHLGLDETLEIIRGCCGGVIQQHSRTEGKIQDTAFGTFKVELDSTALKERAYLRPLEALGMEPDGSLADSIEESVLGLARELVPLELVTPPIPWSRLGELDPLWLALREARAADTHASIFYAFGLHLNPEPPDLELATLLATFKSFLLLEDNIRRLASIDLTRRIAPYIQSFPEAYRRMLVAPDYTPDWTAFIDDYVTYSPTRNRSLDLLPLIMHVRAPDLASVVTDFQLVGARPTYHYRLPNCEIGQEGWSPALDWNRWLLVERLAENPLLLAELGEAYLATPDLPLRLQADGWADEVQDRLGQLEPARIAWSG